MLQALVSGGPRAGAGEGLVRLLLGSNWGRRSCADGCRISNRATPVLEGDDGEFDLVLLDLALPGHRRLCRPRAPCAGRYPALPVAVVSAFDDAPTITRVLNLGASGFIPKAILRRGAAGGAPRGAGRQHLPAGPRRQARAPRRRAAAARPRARQWRPA
ncbi:MAG: hypothetical protein MZW92_00590 [Comamonadaceae bacterium]|nr:hypothetical protein [Comamonadaceae bacterium]